MSVVEYMSSHGGTEQGGARTRLRSVIHSAAKLPIRDLTIRQSRTTTSKFCNSDHFCFCLLRAYLGTIVRCLTTR